MKTKQKLLIADNILIGVGMFMYIRNQDRILQITGQMKRKERKLRNEWVVTIDGEASLCKYTKTKEQLTVDYEGGSISVKSSWNPSDEIFEGEINGKKVVDLKIIKEGRIGNYVIQHMNSKALVTVRSPKTSEFEKIIPVKEKVTKVSKKVTGSSDEQIAVAIALVKSKN